MGLLTRILRASTGIFLIFFCFLRCGLILVGLALGYPRDALEMSNFRVSKMPEDARKVNQESNFPKNPRRLSKNSESSFFQKPEIENTKASESHSQDQLGIGIDARAGRLESSTRKHYPPSANLLHLENSKLLHKFIQKSEHLWSSQAPFDVEDWAEDSVDRLTNSLLRTNGELIRGLDIDEADILFVDEDQTVQFGNLPNQPTFRFVDLSPEENDHEKEESQPGLDPHVESGQKKGPTPREEFAQLTVFFISFGYAHVTVIHMCTFFTHVSRFLLMAQKVGQNRLLYETLSLFDFKSI